MMQDEDHLILLSVFHYVVGCLAALFACFPIIYLILGITIIVAPDNSIFNGDAPPAFLGWLFILLASVMITLGWTFAACVITAGRFLAKRSHYTFCLVMAGVECLFMPFGTVLGIFTIIVLLRPGVKEMFITDSFTDSCGV